MDFLCVQFHSTIKHFLPLLENPLLNGRSLKDIIEARDCGLLLM